MVECVSDAAWRRRVRIDRLVCRRLIKGRSVATLELARRAVAEAVAELLPDPTPLPPPVPQVHFAQCAVAEAIGASTPVPPVPSAQPAAPAQAVQPSAPAQEAPSTPCQAKLASLDGQLIILRACLEQLMNLLHDCLPACMHACRGSVRLPLQVFVRFDSRVAVDVLPSDTVHSVLITFCLRCTHTLPSVQHQVPPPPPPPPPPLAL